MADFYQTKAQYPGSFLGRVLIQANGSIGGKRHVFVHMNDADDAQIKHLPTGCVVKNPFKGMAKLYAYDLMQYDIEGNGYILKTYEAKEAPSGTTLKIVRDGYHHIPFVGDNIMVAPATLEGTGTGVTITAVKENDDNWELTLSATLSGISAGTVLQEAAAAGSGVKAMVTNPNAFLPCDHDFLFDPTAGADKYNGARYFVTPCYLYGGPVAWISKMSPLPPAVKALNKSMVAGFFHL